MSKFSPVVLNSKQERQAGGGGGIIWYSSGNSGKDLWKLKASNPGLFAKQKQAAGGEAGPDAVPPGFEATDKPGWHYNRADKIFFETASRKLFWLDEASGDHKELYEGLTLPISFTGGAASMAEDAGAGAAAKAAPKTVVIPDLHRVASALKADFSHIDRPAAMMGAFGCDVAARGFHEKLVRRLGSSRSHWSDEALLLAVRGALADVSGQAVAVPMAVVVLTGRRAIAVASAGATYRLTRRPVQASTATLAPPSFTVCGILPAGKATPTSSCVTATEEEALFAAVAVSPVVLGQSEFEGILAPQLLKGWARTASIELLRSVRSRGRKEPLAAVCARLVPATAASASSASSSEAPAAKRQKLGSTSPIFAAGTAGAGSGGKGDQVRLRQILLRVVASGPPVVDPVRRKQVKRSQEEAEASMLEVLKTLESDGMASFQKVCREISECQSALKGGELAGDMGWLDRVKGVGIQQDKAKVAVRPQVPAAVLKAAFELAVGEVHDLVTTEVGVHLLQRTA